MKRFQNEVEPSLFFSRRFGNIYNGSLYLCLMSLLYTRPDVKDKRVLMFSYGSGICSTLFSLHVK